MNQTDQINAFLRMSLLQLPILIVCLAAGIVIVARWKQVSRGAMWALLGFGLALSLCFIIPAVQFAVQSLVIQHVDSNANRASLFTGLSFLWATLRAVSYGLLLMAILAGRATSPSAPGLLVNKPSAYPAPP